MGWKLDGKPQSRAKDSHGNTQFRNDKDTKFNINLKDFAQFPLPPLLALLHNQDLITGKVIGSAKEREGLYYLVTEEQGKIQDHQIKGNIEKEREL
ncbi:hypothetical protein CK203_104748 [Vitis vinifera]|uniref:Uncharacterized protein n=1 Tax=Vitis vinifera TaxID=29760 RepID=A0A438E2N2_VITVI|nr:hypothetical protein CK203_104748 [Vitis vinifera]